MSRPSILIAAHYDKDPSAAESSLLTHPKHFARAVTNERQFKTEQTTCAICTAETLRAMQLHWKHTQRAAHAVNHVVECELLHTREAILSCMNKKGQQANSKSVSQLVGVSRDLKTVRIILVA